MSKMIRGKPNQGVAAHKRCMGKAKGDPFIFCRVRLSVPREDASMTLCFTGDDIGDASQLQNGWSPILSNAIYDLRCNHGRPLASCRFGAR